MHNFIRFFSKNLKYYAVSNTFRDTNKEVRSYKGLNPSRSRRNYGSKKGISGWYVLGRIYDYRTEIESEKLRQIPPR